jgi:hypothetical protein
MELYHEWFHFSLVCWPSVEAQSKPLSSYGGRKLSSGLGGKPFEDPAQNGKTVFLGCRMAKNCPSMIYDPGGTLQHPARLEGDAAVRRGTRLVFRAHPDFRNGGRKYDRFWNSVGVLAGSTICLYLWLGYFMSLERKMFAYRKLWRTVPVHRNVNCVLWNAEIIITLWPFQFSICSQQHS